MNELKTTICWFGEKPLVIGQRLKMKHTSKVTPVRVKLINGVIDIEKLDIDESTSLQTNDIGLATLQTADLLVVDDYRANRVTGSFVLIDEATNATVAAGMVGHASASSNQNCTSIAISATAMSASKTSIDFTNARPLSGGATPSTRDHSGQGSLLRQRPRFEVSGDREVAQDPHADPRLRERHRLVATRAT